MGFDARTFCKSVPTQVHIGSEYGRGGTPPNIIVVIVIVITIIAVVVVPHACTHALAPTPTHTDTHTPVITHLSFN